VAVTATEFRRVLGSWASGITIVTTAVGSNRHGMTVSAFTAVSLTPPKILVCINLDSPFHELVRESGYFAVNILAAGQEAISARFAARENRSERFDGVAWFAGESGCPVLEGTAAHLECKVAESAVVGDHFAYVGDVERGGTSERDPLLYFRGDYRKVIYGRRRATRTSARKSTR
jgi:flavin reductase (DIM6/NTAB) family NADH-FMN oxidoreductase RutF